MGGTGSTSLEILIAVQTLAQGGRLAFPPAAPELAVYAPAVAGPAEDWRDEMRRGLEKLLPSWAPERLAALLLRRGELLEVAVELDLRSRELDRGGRLRGLYPCLVSADEASRWVSVLRLGHSFHASAKDDLPALAAAEIGRVLKARIAAGEDPLALLPAAATRLELLPLRLGAVFPQPASGAAAVPPSRASGRVQRAADLGLLASIGIPFVPSERGLLPRPAEESRLAPLLAGKRRSSVLVTGAAGAGKSALIRRVLAGRQQVYLTSGYQWVAGASLAGQLEERVEQVMAAAQRLDAILYFERFDELLTSREGGDDLISLFRRFVTGEKVRLLGELDSERLDEAQRAQASFFAAMTVVRVEPMGGEDTREILLGRLAELLPDPERGPLREALAEGLLEVAGRYFADRPLPGVAAGLLDELAAGEAEARAAGRQLGLGDLYRLVSGRTGIPELLLRDDQALRLDALREVFKGQVVGQDAAVEQLVSTLATVKARLQPEGKPLAVLLFVGPTGVGKTEAARCLARLLFGDEKRLIRFDMSEFADRFSADRLIRGNDRDEGLLTRRVRREPFAVVLLDEIEKAHRSVFDLLLQVAGEGRLTDSRGRTASFHNVILILTSNLGAAEQRGQPLGFAPRPPSAQAYYGGQVEDFFRPELVNRLDQVIAFLPLGQEELATIARIQVAALGRRRGFEERGIALEVDEAVIDAVAAAGLAPAHGARRLRREIRNRLIAPAAELIARSAGRLPERSRLRIARLVDAEPVTGMIGRKIAGGFSFVLQRAAPGDPSDEMAGGAPAKPGGQSRPRLESLQNLRRVLRRLLQAETLDGLAHEISLARRRIFQIQLEMQKLGEESRQRGPATPRQVAALLAESARLEQRRHRFEEALQPLRQLRQEIEDAEELALAELLDASSSSSSSASSAPSPGAFDGRQLDDWLARLRRALGKALLAPDEGPALTLLLTEAGEASAFELWLRPLLAESRRLGLALGGWPLGERLPLGDGARLAAAALEAWLDTPKRGRQLILEVGDPEWAARLAWEAGWHAFVLHRLERAGKPEQAAYLSVERAALGRLGEQERERLRRGHLQRQPPAADWLRRQSFRREWRLEEDWWWPAERPAGRPLSAPTTLALLRQAGLDRFPLLGREYWQRQVEMLAGELALFELGEGDRDGELARRLALGPAAAGEAP